MNFLNDYIIFIVGMYLKKVMCWKKKLPIILKKYFKIVFLINYVDEKIVLEIVKEKINRSVMWEISQYLVSKH